MSANHWSRNALPVRVFGVNAVATIPVILFAVRPSYITFFLFVAVLAFFLIVENLMGLRGPYIVDLIRFHLSGITKSPKSRNFDL